MMPFSLGMLLELLFGELGPEPGALLHAESETGGGKKEEESAGVWKKKQKRFETAGSSPPPPPPPPLTRHVEGALLGRSDGTVSAAEQRAAAALADFLLQPGAQLQVGLRGCRDKEGPTSVT